MALTKMLSTVTPWLLLLFGFSYAQSATTSDGQSDGAAAPVTVTSVSTLAIVIIPTSGTSSTGLPSTSVSTTLITSPSKTLAFPTVPFTGQAILTGVCNVPQYTSLALHDGAVIEVPLVGCSDDRPDCCPSLSPPESASTETSKSTSTISITSITGLVATGVIPRLSASPLSICPHDFVDIDPVCCPRGYSLYPQVLVGGITPCYSMLTTSMPLPASVSSSIVSAAAETASTAATVSVIINQVYALGLPCAEESSGNGSLSTGAKIGIGVGAGVGGILLFALLFIAGMFVHRSMMKKRSKEAQSGQTQDKHEIPNLYSTTPIMSMGSPVQPHMSPQFPNAMMYGFPTNQGYNPNVPHASWMSQSSVPPQYRPPTVEVHAQPIYEADAEAKVESPPKNENTIMEEANVSNAHGLPAER